MALHKLAAIVSLILMWPSCLSKFHNFVSIIVSLLFIRPESDHCLPLSVTNSLTNCLVNLIDVTLACEDDNSKLVTVAYEKRVDNRFVQILKLKFGQYFAAVIWLRL